jgi:capsular polysaccharide biosynthesis protein
MRPIEPGEAQVVARFASPEFRAAPPVLRYGELIPPDIRAAMQPSWERGIHHARDATLYALEDVTVAREGLVFDRNHDLYAPSVTQHAQGEIAETRSWLATDDAPRQAGRYVLCKKRGVQNYGHFLTEMLPRAWLVRHCLAGPEARFILADIGGRLRQVMIDAMAQIGIPEGCLVFLGDRPVRLETVLLLDGLTTHGVYMSPRVFDCIDHLVAAVPAGAAPRLFISRRDIGYRRFADDAAGYAVIQPARFRLRDQISLFKGARQIAGVTGAGLANAAFAPAGARLINLAPAGMPDTFFWFIASPRGLSYEEVRCAQSGLPRGPTLWDTDLLPPQDLAAILREQ